MNPIVTILNLRNAEKQLAGSIQHQSAEGNKALIVAFIAHQNFLGIEPRSKDVIAAMNKSQPMVSKYLNQLAEDGIIIDVGGTKRTARGWYVEKVNINA